MNRYRSTAALRDKHRDSTDSGRRRRDDAGNGYGNSYDTRSTTISQTDLGR